MTTSTLKDQIIHEVDKLTEAQQEQRLDMARRLQYSPLPPGTPGAVLVSHMGAFDFAPGAVDDMMRIIEEGCSSIR